MHSIYHVLLVVWGAKVSQFWPIWTTLTVVGAVFGAWLVGQADGKPIHQSSKFPIEFSMTRPFGWPRSAWPAVVWFGIFVLCYVALIFVWEDFADADNSYITLATLRNHIFGPPIWAGSGRFYPLAFQDFNLDRHFTSSVAGYHILPVLQLLVICFILLILDQDLSTKARVWLAAWALLTPGMMISFGGLVFPERNVVFWMLCLAYCVRRFDQTQSTAVAVAAIVCAQFMLYYKETAFLFLWGFVAGRLLFRGWNANRPGFDFSRLRGKASRLDLCLASLGLIFLFYYCAIMFGHTSLQYEKQSRLPELVVLLDYFKMDLMMYLFLAVVAGRTYLIWKRRIMPSPFWDGLAYGGLAYFAGFVLLGLVRAYYFAPVDVIAVLYLGRLAILSWGKLPANGKVMVCLLSSVVLLQGASLSAYSVCERKNIIHAKAEIASEIQAQYHQDGGNGLRLYFPFASRYLTMEFGAYLSYRGLPIEGVGDEATGSNSVVLVSQAMAKGGPLGDYHGMICHYGQAPEPGDMVIILPDDNASLADVAPYQDGGNLLLSYQPRPSLPTWSWFLVRHLHYAYPNSFVIPNRWLNASVTIWNGGHEPER